MSAEWDLMEQGFTVLAVCTGNVCRSPLTERLLQHALDDIAPGQFSISSAGTLGLTGQSVEPQIAEIAAEQGVSLSGFTARELTPDLILQAHLILTMERDHRSRIVQLVPAALRRTFTLREFARILPHVPPETSAQPAQRWHSLVAMAQRHRRPPESPELDDVIDPYGCSDKVYEDMTAQLVPAVNALIDWERGCSSKAS
ncbi:low molecular weight phosphatase family protein [Nesterenkonia massiliensis]|uniref:arsenate reductase/protein-tyrosine-phosphatase family protein n=1 Tax=Nesterenkonia massiliensis TaxID=1232429 RepID=UPI00040B4213|nr:low molecular weight phosphatase family protein [Nesterenkonia massiliensis]